MRYNDFSHHILFTPKSYYEFSKQWFDTVFIDEKMLSPFKLLNYYFSKDVDKKLEYLRSLLKIGNNYTDGDNKPLLMKFILLYKYTKKYLATNKSIKFSKKFLPDEKVFFPVFIAISKPKK